MKTKIYEIVRAVQIGNTKYATLVKERVAGNDAAVQRFINAEDAISVYSVK